MLYADDIVLLANSAEELQVGLNLLIDYNNKWMLMVNIYKTSVMFLEKGVFYLET